MYVQTKFENLLRMSVPSKLLVVGFVSYVGQHVYLDSLHLWYWHRSAYDSKLLELSRVIEQRSH